MGLSFRTSLINTLLLLSCFCLDFGSARSIITSANFIRDPETLSSNDNAIKLGFFSPQTTINRYLGIWYLNESNVIWVANRNQPLRDSSGIFTISQDGNLVVLNGHKQVVWSSNVSKIASNSAAKLLDTGNLILQDLNTEETVWESFKHPCDTAVPSFKLTTNRTTGEKMIGTSWKSPSDPSIGHYSASLERLNAPELFLWVNGSHPYARSGPWNGRIFIGITGIIAGYLYGWSVGNEEDGNVYVTYYFGNKSYFATLSLTSQGKIKLVTWDDRKEIFKKEFEVTDCDVYGQCGAWGSCNLETKPICSCLSGFEPRNLEEWNKQNWASGCVRKAPLQCDRVKNGSEVGTQDGFVKHENVKVPDFAERSAAKEIEECRTQCFANCSCIAYAYEAGIGCMYWNRSLIDIQKFSDGGVDLYVRVAHSELASEKKKNKRVITIIAIAVSVGTIILAACASLSWKYTAKITGRKCTEHQIQRMIADAKHNKLEELPLYDFRKIANATNDFHSSNLLGKGGFGPVYKGELQDGQKIAVKRLSRASCQGLEEFMNEVVVISKLQHRNLVRLLGCCIEGDEKMLIYEFMPNKRLDACLFDQLQQKLLDWKKRINIIKGIARGLLYLHRDSRLRIIHRDLKASNILLDEEMNPKISDFGLARIFKGNEEECNTKRVVGTYGYMSPEYAMEGHFSEKSDIYSFGVLLLEIVSGKRNTGFYNNEHSISLIGFAWKLWNEENIKALIDPEILNPVFENQILRCIHVGLLCVQELINERPSMTTVVSMLNSEIGNLPPPGQVAFVQRRNLLSLENCQGPNSVNNVTLSEIQGR